jgi:serine carboxypeptidase-like clade IV
VSYCLTVSVLFQGFAIGNGLTVPEIQYGAYADFVLDMGLIGESTHKTISKIYPLCKL